MSRVTRKEWYRRVNAAWPAQLPPLTPIEAIRAARKLYRFALGATFPAQNVRLTSGRRYSYIRRGIMFVNPGGHSAGSRRGWEALVHDLSHYFDNRLSPDTRPHASAHARLEIRLIKEVVARGWLGGSLKDEERTETTAAVAAPQAEKLGRVLRLMEGWEKKRRRAENALRKLGRQRRYYERKLGAGASESRQTADGSDRGVA